MAVRFRRGLGSYRLEAAIDNSWFDERAMRSEKWKLTLRDFTADPRASGNALFDMVKDPGETTNLYYHAEYREPLEEQLRLMAEQATELQDPLALKLANEALARLDEPGPAKLY